MDEIETAEQIYAIADIPIAYLTSYTDEKTVERAKRTEPCGFLIKPARDRELYSTIKAALNRHNMKKKLKEKTKS